MLTQNLFFVRLFLMTDFIFTTIDTDSEEFNDSFTSSEHHLM